MSYTMKAWSVLLLLFAVGLSMCMALSLRRSAHCQTKKIRCPCSDGSFVLVREKQCFVAGSCRRCEGGRPLACDQVKVVSKCTRRLEEGITEARPRITFFELEGNQVETIGASVNLTCEAEYATFIAFLKSGKLLMEDQRITYFHEELAADRDGLRTKVQIKNITSEDVGKYKCVAISATGLRKSKSLTLKLHKPTVPTITNFELEANEVASVGASVNLTCQADHVTLGVIVFQKSGKLLMEDQRITYFQQELAADREGLKTKVQIKNITSTDEGKYECVAISATGLRKSKSLTLKLHDKLGAGISRRKRRSSLNHEASCTKDGVLVKANATGPPKVTINGKSKTKFVDDTITITCSVNSDPAARVVWLFNGASLSATQEKRYKKLHCNQSLTISSAEIGDSGNFTCTATNENGTSSESALVSVEKMKKYDPFINVFKVDGERCEAYLGGSINITCQAFHADFITFFKSVKYIHDDDDHFTYVHSPSYEHGGVETKLKIKNVSLEDAGNYTCVAGSFSGQRVAMTTFLRIELCPANFYCPAGGNKAYPCPTCNGKEIQVVHQCKPCHRAAVTRGPSSNPFPLQFALLITVCVVLFLVLVITLAVYLRYHKRLTSVNLSRAESPGLENNEMPIRNNKPPREQHLLA